MRALTRRQSEALGFINSFLKKNGFPPTMRTIAQELGIASTNGISDHLDALEAKGKIVRENGRIVTKATLVKGSRIEEEREALKQENLLHLEGRPHTTGSISREHSIPPYRVWNWARKHEVPLLFGRFAFSDEEVISCVAELGGRTAAGGQR